MKTKFFKTLLILAIAFLAPAVLSGCKAKCPKPTENIPGTSTFRADCPYEEAAAGSGQKELNFYFVHDNTDDFKEQIQAFQSKNQGVVIRTKKFDNLQEYEDAIINEIAQGEGPDVFMVHNTWLPKHYKKLLPLPANQPIIMSADLFRQTFFQAATDDLIIDEKVYGMPMSIDNLAVFYNKAYFRDLLTADRPSDLWEGIKEQVATLTKRNNSPERFALAGMAMGRADNISSAIDILYALMLEYGVGFYDEKEEKAIFADGGAVGQEAPGVSALTLFTSFALSTYKHSSWNDTITGYAPEEKEINPFVRGKVAMVIGYPYLYSAIQQGIENQQRSGSQHIDLKDVGVAPFPQLVSGTEATKRDTYASYFPLVVARTTKYPQEAWSFVQFMTSADALQTYYKKTHRPTSRRDMIDEQQTDPIFGAFAYQASFAKSFKVFDATAYNKIFSDAIQQVVMNMATPEEALKQAQDKITCVIRKQKGLAGSETDCGI
ncbi:extracellular solute-binding protein [Candidatus Peregrinibacteria bacterium]|nr:extracellular solute-binding protein [Candidatus Peregrinibacteria bacterium]